jgi:hypothetical protein
MPFVLMHHKNEGAAQSQYAATRQAFIAHPLALAREKEDFLRRRRSGEALHLAYAV